MAGFTNLNGIKKILGEIAAAVADIASPPIKNSRSRESWARRGMGHKTAAVGLKKEKIYEKSNPDEP
jgi:hypothetical protein